MSDRTAPEGTPVGPEVATRRGRRAVEAARHALRIPPVPRHFRADIEGMRAVAVLAVVLWHAGVTVVPGGFTGVDVFFVVSGFLMTALLLEEAREHGRIDVGRFYARRARRLLPAALSALVGTAVLTLLFLPRGRWAEIGGDLVASALYLVNWRLADRSVDYLAVEQLPSPLQHYWSLAVEEQFYIVWPLVLIAVLAVAAGRAAVFRRASWVVTLGLLVASLGVSWWWTQHDAAAYFVTPTRVFELMLGAVVALGARGWLRLPRLLAAAVAWAGLAMVLASLVAITAQTPFPGTWALLPTGGAALVLVGGPAAGGWGPLAVLRARVLQWFGRLSYSFYLWHWPFVAVATELAGVDRGGPASLPVQWGLLAVTLSLIPAWLSFRYIEDPIRVHGRLLATELPPALVTWRTLRLGLNCTLAGVLLGVGMLSAGPSTVTSQAAQWRTPAVVDDLRAPVGAGTLAGGFTDDGGTATPPAGDDAARTTPAGPAEEAGATAGPGPSEQAAAPELAAAGAGLSVAVGEPLPEVEIPQQLGALAVPLAQVPDDLPVETPAGCFADLPGTEVLACEGGYPSGRVTVALIGDSHAGMWMSVLNDIGRERGWRVVAMTKSSCPPGVGLPVERAGESGEYTQCTAWQEALTPALEALDPDLVLMSSATYSSPAPEEFARGLAERVAQVEDDGAMAALIRDVPRAPFPVPDCLVENPDEVPACAFPRSEALARAGTGHDELTQLLPGLPVLDLTDSICPGRLCSPVVGGVVVWRDSNHLSDTYVRSLRDILEPQVQSLVYWADMRVPATFALEHGVGLGG